MIALSIRQPWAWLIFNAGKDIENRTWHTNVRGRVLIHAAKGCTRAELEDAELFLYCRVQPIQAFLMPATVNEMDRGGIVGSVEIVDCVSSSNSLWFTGPQGFVLRDPQPLPFMPFKGQLGFFDVPGVQP